MFHYHSTYQNLYTHWYDDIMILSYGDEIVENSNVYSMHCSFNLIISDAWESFAIMQNIKTQNMTA